jgi:hypothetical protein
MANRSNAAPLLIRSALGGDLPSVAEARCVVSWCGRDGFARGGRGERFAVLRREGT